MPWGQWTFAIVLSLAGAFSALAQCPPPPEFGADACYLLKFKNLHPRILPIRTPDIDSPEKKLHRVLKIQLLPREKEPRIGHDDVKFCHVETVLSARGGPPPTQGWIESTYIGARARTCGTEMPIR